MSIKLDSKIVKNLNQNDVSSYLREIKGIGIIRKTLYGKPCYGGLIETTESECHIEPLCKFF